MCEVDREQGRQVMEGASLLVRIGVTDPTERRIGAFASEVEARRASRIQEGLIADADLSVPACLPAQAISPGKRVPSAVRLGEHRTLTESRATAHHNPHTKKGRHNMATATKRGVARLLTAAMVVASGVSMLATTFAPGTAQAAAKVATAKQSISIAQIFDTIDSSRQAEITTENSVIAQFNATHPQYNVTLTTYNPQLDVQTQISDMETALLKKPSVILFVPVNTTGSLAAVKLAKKAGVPVINQDPTTPESSLYTASFQVADEQLYAQGTVNYIKAYLAAHPSVVLHMGLIFGAPTNQPTLVRESAIQALAKEMPGRIKIEATAFGNWLTATAQSLSQDWLEAHPDINFISCANDIMATGAANAVKLAKMEGKVQVSGYDLTPAGLQRVQAGTEAVDVGAVNAEYGWVIDAAIEVALGTYKGAPGWTGNAFNNKEVYEVTKANVNKMVGLANALTIPFAWPLSL